MLENFYDRGRLGKVLVLIIGILQSCFFSFSHGRIPQTLLHLGQRLSKTVHLTSPLTGVSQRLPFFEAASKHTAFLETILFEPGFGRSGQVPQSFAVVQKPILRDEL